MVKLTLLPFLCPLYRRECPTILQPYFLGMKMGDRRNITFAYDNKRCLLRNYPRLIKKSIIYSLIYPSFAISNN
jgi:hypothetical protein